MPNPQLNISPKNGIDDDLWKLQLEQSIKDSEYNIEEYKNYVKKEEKKEEWDELEKSVIASVADDITVGIKGTSAEIVIIKKFA